MTWTRERQATHQSNGLQRELRLPSMVSIHTLRCLCHRHRRRVLSGEIRTSTTSQLWHRHIAMDGIGSLGWRGSVQRRRQIRGRFHVAAPENSLPRRCEHCMVFLRGVGDNRLLLRIRRPDASSASLLTLASDCSRRVWHVSRVPGARRVVSAEPERVVLLSERQHDPHRPLRTHWLIPSRHGPITLVWCPGSSIGSPSCRTLVRHCRRSKEHRFSHIVGIVRRKPAGWVSGSNGRLGIVIAH